MEVACIAQQLGAMGVISNFRSVALEYANELGERLAISIWDRRRRYRRWSKQCTAI
jgi:hypothetical protein